MGERLVILGGSNCQMSAFRRARARGLEPILLDYLERPPAAALAARHIPVSTFDIPGCLEAARAVRAAGILTLGTDQPVLTAARVADALGLPSLIDPQTALTVTNKAVMKATLVRHDLPTLPYAVCDRAALAKWPHPGPLVIKPLDSQGQKGVFRAESRGEALTLFDRTLSYSRCGELLCEPYYPALEITVSGWVSGGRCHVLTVTDRVTFEARRHIGVCAGHRYPSRAARGCLDQVIDISRRIPAAFGIREGPLYIQMLLGERGIRINELACRIGGAFEDLFIPMLTGFDILDGVIDGALGLPVPLPEVETMPAGSVRVLLPFARPGTLGALTPLEEILALPGVLDAGYNFRPGDSLPVFENAGARLGHVVLYAASEPEMEDRLRQFYSLFRVLDTAGRDMLLEQEI